MVCVFVSPDFASILLFAVESTCGEQTVGQSVEASSDLHCHAVSHRRSYGIIEIVCSTASDAGARVLLLQLHYVICVDVCDTGS